jgi:hypothetical protein
MKTKLSLLTFILFPAFAFSQTKIQGKVLDKETQKPVPDVIVHSSGKISITNDRGEYDFEINQSETVYFRHLSYNPLKMQSDSLQNNNTVYLTSNVTELSEVVISPNRAKYLLNTAVNNLIANFQKEKTKAYYLTHVEENTTKGGEREVYALIETVLDKMSLNGKFCNWDLKLIQLDRIKNVDENDFIGKGKNISTDFFPDNLYFSFGKAKDTTAFFVEIYDENSDYWIIKTYPQYLNKQYYYYSLYTINRQDTVLTEFIDQSYADSNELTTRNFKRFSYNMSNHFNEYKFSKNASGLYYLEQFQHLAHLKIIADMPHEMILKAVVHRIENTSLDKFENEKKKRLFSTFSYYLFKNKLPDSPGFWKKYVKP